MISPPVTVCPANVFTPSRCALESRPLRLDPSPFLCAIGPVLLRSGFRGFRGFGGFHGFVRSFRFGGGFRLVRVRRRSLGGILGFGFGGAERQLGDLDPRQLLAVARAPLVAALGLEL